MGYACWRGLFSAESSGREELLAAQYGVGHSGPPAKALKEGWVILVTSRAPRKEQRVFARLVADALVFYQDEPKVLQEQLAAGSGSGAGAGTLLQVVLLSHVASVLGRAEGSEHVRIADGRGCWWQLRPESQEQVPEWAEPLAKRFDQFRTARRRSSLYTGAQQDDLKLQLEAARQASKSRLWRRLASMFPCGGFAGPDFSKAVGGSNKPYSGSREGAGELVDTEALAKVTDPDLMEAQGGHWSDAAVKYLQRCEEIPEELSVDFNASVHKGVPDGLKRLIWPLAAGKAIASKVANVNADEFYHNLLDRSFGGIHPAEFQDPVPTFCQGVHGVADAPPLKSAVKHLWLLKPQGQHALRRLLWVTQLTSHGTEFCPFLPNLMMTLLPFFSEAETMFIVSQLLTEEESAASSDNPRIILNLHQLQKQAKLLVHEGRKRGNVPEVLSHLESIGMKLDELATRLLQDGLASKLPFRVLCRVVGAFLAQGSEVILRFALALLKQQASKLLACKTAEEVLHLLDNLAEGLGDGPGDVDLLTKVAFSLPVKSSLARVTSRWGISYAAPDQDRYKRIFCRPRLFQPRGSVPDDVWEKIWGWVPANCRIFDPSLIYAPVMDGTSMRTCLEKCKKHKDAPMVFFIYSKGGDIIGGFSPMIWVRTHGYLDLLTAARGAEDAFVFRRPAGRSEVDIYAWSGANQMLLDASEVHGLVFGGNGAAMHVSKDLQRASSSASETFRSPSLAGEGDPFEMVRFEVFALQ